MVWHHHCQSTVTIPHPNHLRNQSPALRAFAIGLAFLGLCVFAWGLKYKLSLYDPPRAISHHMPAAKLLTGNERRALPVVDPRRTAVSSGILAFSTLALALLAFAVAQWLVTLRGVPLLFVPVRLAPARSRTVSSFIRPPPRLR